MDVERHRGASGGVPCAHSATHLYRRVHGRTWRILSRGYYIDDVYGSVFARTGKLASAWLAFRFDARIIDGAVEGTGGLVRRIGGWLRPLQTGFVRSYGLAIVAGAVGLMVWFLSRGGL